MYDRNPYYSPERFDPPLEIVAEISLTQEGPYQFHYLVLWRVKGTQDYYSAQDSGCSCPTPFEDHWSLDKLMPVKRRIGVGSTTFSRLKEIAKAHGKTDEDYFYGYASWSSIMDFCKLVDRAERSYRKARR